MTTFTVGSGQQYTTLAAAIAVAKPGDTIDLQAGTYTDDFPGQINGLTIEGVGGTARLVATAQPGNGKAILDVSGNTTLRNLDISGVTVPDANGAGIRYESGTLLVQNSVIHGNQDGILGAPDPTGSITIDGSEFYGNGTSTGSTHNIYIGDIANFTLTNSYIHDANTGHEVKSRAETNVITNNRILDNGSTASYEIDLPNGGNATISGNVIQKSANSGNHVTIAYGEEGSLHSGTTVSVTNNAFGSDQSGADVLWDVPGTTISAVGNSTYGYAAIYKAGHVDGGGFNAQSSRPALTTASASQTTPSDTIAPTLTVTKSAAGVTQQTSDTLSGTVSDSGSGVASVEIYDTTGGKTVDRGSATLLNGTWNYSATGLADGTHAFTAVATDKAGNSTAAQSAGPALIVDTTAPTLTVNQRISGTTTSTTNTVFGSVSDAGTGVAAVEIFVNSAGRSVDLGQAKLDGGNWTYSFDHLAPGTYTFYAVGFDNAGHTTATIQTGAAVTVVKQTTDPSFLAATESVSGVTNRAIDTISGTVSSTVAKVEIFDTVGGKTVDLGAATLVNGQWSYAATGLANGSHAFTAIATDRFGTSTAAQSAGPALVVDTQAPTLTVGQSISGITTSTANVVSGTVVDAGTGVAAVEIFVNSAGRSVDLGQATLDGGTWSYTASNLAPGTYTFYAVGFDNAGNTTATIQTGAAQTVVAKVETQSVAMPKAVSTVATNTVTAPTTVSAAAFTASVGVNTHLDYKSGGYANTATVINSLKYLGVSNVRDSAAAPGDAALFKTVSAATGVKFDLYLSLSGYSYDGEIAEIKSAASVLTSVEGINEGDSSLSQMAYGGQTGYAAIAAAQAALYQAIKANAATNGVTVIGPSYGNVADFALAAKTASVSDRGNAHEYFGTGNPPGGGIAEFITYAAQVSGSEPVVATETGYYTGGSLSGSIAAYQHSGVSELVQAKYDLTLLFDDWKAGIKSTYLYELMDDASDPGNTNSENHFGLFNADGSPKLAATAIHNLLSTLADTGTARTDGFGFQLAQAPSTANSLLMEKSTGVFDLAVWNDIRLASSTTGADVFNAAVPITISFGQYVQSAVEYDPLLGTGAVLRLSNVDHVDINLPDHPVIFEITPYAPTKMSLQSFVLPQTVASSQSTSNLANAILGNAIETDPNSLSTVKITSVGTSGTYGRVSFDVAKQSVVYTAPFFSPLSPTDSFTYTLTDAQGNAVTGTVAISETPPPNTLYGTTAGDRINAPATGWTLVSLAAGEQLYSDFSGTTFIGGSDTKMFGGTANNIFTAGNGSHFVGAGDNARITLGNGDNTLGLTGSGSTVVTGNGNNLLYKSTGNTSVTMGDGNQSITMGGQNNVITIGSGTSTINIGNDGGAAGNERITVGGGTNTINAGGSGDTITVKGGVGNRIVTQGSAATIIVQAGTNNVVAQGANSAITTLAGVNDIGTNGDGDTISLGSGRDVLWAGGNNNRITAGSGVADITFVGQHDTVDLTHGTTVLHAQGAAATLILSAPGGTAAQIFGNVIGANDMFDLRTALGATTWNGEQKTLASYLSVSNAGNTSVISIDSDGTGPGAATAIASLNEVSGLNYAGLLSRSAVNW